MKIGEAEVLEKYIEWITLYRQVYGKHPFCKVYEIKELRT